MESHTENTNALFRKLTMAIGSRFQFCALGFSRYSHGKSQISFWKTTDKNSRAVNKASTIMLFLVL